MYQQVTQENLKSYSCVVCHVSTARVVSCLAYSLALMMETRCSSNFTRLHNIIGSRDSLVCMATGYGLDDQGQREFESR
jgi:hypothetical protein